MFGFKSFSVSILFTLFCVGIFCSPVTAASLIVEDGVLTGAANVRVEGSLYNVKFVDGSAQDLFMADDEYIFTFKTITSSFAASQALLDQVFIDEYNDDPTLTNGISYDTAGYIMTPYTRPYYVFVTLAMNYSSTLSQNEDKTAQYMFLATTDTGISDRYVWAVWTPVPVPGSILLAGAGLLGLAGIRRKND